MICRGVTSKCSTVLVRSLDVAAWLLLPDFDAAGIHELAGVALGRAEQPGDEAPSAARGSFCWMRCIT